jgi:hypothetical protein
MIRLDRGTASVPHVVPAVNSNVQFGSFVGALEAASKPAGTTAPSAQTPVRGSITASCSALRSASVDTLAAPTVASAHDAWGTVLPDAAKMVAGLIAEALARPH